MNATIRGNAQRGAGGDGFRQLLLRCWEFGRNWDAPSSLRTKAAPGAGAVAVISDGIWEREFGRSPAVLGQTITLNQTALTIVGVNPRGFTGAQSVQQSPDVFVPLSMQPLVNPWGTKASLLTQPDNWWVKSWAASSRASNETEVRAALDVELAAAVRGTMTVKAGETMPRMLFADGSRGLHLSWMTHSRSRRMC